MRAAGTRRCSIAAKQSKIMMKSSMWGEVMKCMAVPAGKKQHAGLYMQRR